VFTHIVIAGLDPAIHSSTARAKPFRLGRRVKPGKEVGRWAAVNEIESIEKTHSDPTNYGNRQL